jgi:hypothetical protein
MLNHPAALHSVVTGCRAPDRCKELVYNLKEWPDTGTQTTGCANNGRMRKIGSSAEHTILNKCCKNKLYPTGTGFATDLQLSTGNVF